MSKRLGGLLVVLVVLVGIMLWSWRQPCGSSPLSYLNSNNPSPSPTPVVVKKKTTATKSVTAPATDAQYGQLASQYGQAGRLIQFDSTCHVTPGQLTIKTGSKVMLDNRSAVAKTVKLDSTSYSLPAYNYRVVTVSTNQPLPHDLMIDCQSSNGGTENGVIIKLQGLISNQLP